MTPRREAQPLPECQRCQEPTRRAAYLRNGGLCSSCHDALSGSPLRPVQLELEGL